jgi:hypothetical protein
MIFLLVAKKPPPPAFHQEWAVLADTNFIHRRPAKKLQ